MNPVTLVLTIPSSDISLAPEDIDPSQWAMWLIQQSTPTRPDWYHGDEPPGGGVWDAQAMTPQIRSCAHGDNDDAVLRTVGLLLQERRVLSGQW